MPTQLFDDGESGASAERRQVLKPRRRASHSSGVPASQSPVANPRTSTTASWSLTRLQSTASPSPARQQQHRFATPVSSKKRPEASAMETPETRPAKKRRSNNPLSQN